jgi:hypothetical protein
LIGTNVVHVLVEALYVVVATVVEEDKVTVALGTLTLYWCRWP